MKLPGDDTGHLKKIWEELASSDLLVIGNGRLFVDISLDFMRGPLPYFALLVTLAKFLNVPVMIFSMTIVPVKSKMGRTLIKYIVSNANIIAVREESSREELLKLGISGDKINVIPDAAFGLDYIDRKERGMQILAQEGIDLSEKRFIGMNFRYTHLDTSVGQGYYSALGKLCDELYENIGTDILLISQMTYGVDNPLDDDREVYKLVYENCVNKEHIHIIAGRYNVFDTIAIYQLCEMVFSMRRHGIIFAATQNIPVFILSGERSSLYAMQALNLPENVLQASQIQDKYASQVLIGAFEKRKHILQSLSITVPRLRKATRKFSELAYEIAIS